LGIVLATEIELGCIQIRIIKYDLDPLVKEELAK
jgi:hypothetical protein